MHEQTQVLKAIAFEPTPRPKDVVFIFNKNMKLAVKITMDDFIVFNKVVAKRSQKNGNLKWYATFLNVGRWALLGIAAASMVDFYKEYRCSDLTTLSISLVFIGLWIIAGYGLQYWHYNAYVKHLADGSDTILGEFSIIVEDQWIREISDHHEVKYNWVSIKDIVVEKNVLIIFADDVKGIMIPLYDMPEESKELLITELQKHIKFEL